MMATTLLNVVLLLLTSRVHCFNTTTRTTFTKIPKTFNFAGLKCARDHYTTHRAVRYNLLTGKCEPLDDAWFLNQTIDHNFNYFKLFMVEPHFTPSMAVNQLMPERRYVGMSVVMYVEKIQVGISGRQTIDFGSLDMKLMALHVKLTPNKKVTMFNQHNPTWGTELNSRHMFQQTSLRIYKLEFRFTEDTIDTFIDGDILLKFANQIPLTQIPFIRFESNMTICHRIRFFYPQ